MNRFGLFCSSGIDFAVPLASLVKILPGEHCYRLPKLPRSIVGVVVENGQLIPQLDLSQLLPCIGDKGDVAEYQVFVDSECGTLALEATRSCGIVAEQKGRVVVQGPPVHGIAGEFHFHERIFQILDIDCLAIGLIQESW